MQNKGEKWGGGDPNLLITQFPYFPNDLVSLKYIHGHSKSLFTWASASYQVTKGSMLGHINPPCTNFKFKGTMCSTQLPFKNFSGAKHLKPI
jgi:hypothetical protein